jgi:pyruvate formate lyase activating enzyme
LLKSIKGLINKIQRFSLHDGPGIRTLVVTKSCPLNCLWCSSPQTQKARPELLYIRSRCQGCGHCIRACPEKAIAAMEDEHLVRTNRNLCLGCGACVTACLNRAREIAGRYYSVEDLLLEIEKDTAFYRRSGGGVTVGGGEPAMQAEFVGRFLSVCQTRQIHTVMETSALASWIKLAPLIECLDLVYIDVKHMDERRHFELTGSSNRLILDNIKRAAGFRHMILRIPVVPGLNDSADNILNTVAFARTLGSNLLRLELLPYHKFGRHGYYELERRYEIEAIEAPADDFMEEMREMVQKAGIAAEIGG